MKNFKEYINRIKESMNTNCKNCENLLMKGDFKTVPVCIIKNKVINNYLEATKCENYEKKVMVS